MPIDFGTTALNPLASTGFPGGDLNGSDIADLRKALSAGYGTDVSTLTGGAALRIQSLDNTLQTTIQENDQFKLYNLIAKSKPTATVDEWTEQNGVGGFPGGSANSESGVISTVTGNYNRRVGQVKYLMTQRQVTFVQTLQNTITDSQAVEYRNGALQLLTDCEYLMFEGNSAVVNTEFDGIFSQLLVGIASGLVDPNNVIDAQGAALSDQTYIVQASRQIAKAGNFGTGTHVFLPLSVQSDLDNGLMPAFRVALNNVSGGGTQLGAPVNGIRTTQGDIATVPDVFIRDGDNKQPFELLYPAVAAAQASIVPTGVAVALAADPTSLFSAPRAGNYYYYVTGTNQNGTSQGVLTAAQAIAAGNSATLTISRSASAQETGYVIYRSRQNGTNALADLRELARIPASGGATTVWKDNSTIIPGSTKAFVLNMKKGSTAITWREMLPMVKFNLYPTNAAIVPWAQLMFGYLRISKLRQHVVIHNIIPTSSAWQPFTTATSAATTGVSVPVTG